MIASYSSSTLFPVGEVNICPGETALFTCQVSTTNHSQPVLPQINWWIQFEAPDRDLSDVHQNFISADPLGDLQTEMDTSLHST